MKLNQRVVVLLDHLYRVNSNTRTRKTLFRGAVGKVEEVRRPMKRGQIPVYLVRFRGIGRLLPMLDVDVAPIPDIQ